MKLVYKIAIGTAVGFAAGYGVWRVIYNHRLKNAEANKNQQKEILIQQILIFENLPDTEANRNLYRGKTIEELNDYIKNHTEVPAPPPEEEFYDPTDTSNTTFLYSDYSDYLQVSDKVGYYGDYTTSY